LPRKMESLTEIQRKDIEKRAYKKVFGQTGDLS
jgi:hypothetical protein